MAVRSITIIENNLIGPNLGGIVVNGGTGTTKVSITQTETDSPSLDGHVTITDAGVCHESGGHDHRLSCWMG